jgi:hypothetical protein
MSKEHKDKDEKKPETLRYTEIKAIIQKHVDRYEKENESDTSKMKGKPFLKHVDYFRSDSLISTESIADKWQALSKEFYPIPYTKAMITIRGANAVMAREFEAKKGSIESIKDKTETESRKIEEKKCPYHEAFRTEEIMPLLKHPNDTGIINKDGSINYDILLAFCNEYFIYSDYDKTYILPESSMRKYLELCVKRDMHLNSNFAWYLPSAGTVASAEWTDFYRNFADCFKISSIPENIEASYTPLKYKIENAITLDTFCQFYYFGDELYKRNLSGELPIKCINKHGYLPKELSEKDVEVIIRKRRRE